MFNPLIGWLFGVLSVASPLPGSGPGQSAGAGSPFTDYTAGVAIYLFVIGVLVSVLLISGFLMVNIGLLSKRPEDRLGGRNPSDLGILKTNIWPEAPFDRAEFPAEEEGEGEERPAA